MAKSKPFRVVKLTADHLGRSDRSKRAEQLGAMRPTHLSSSSQYFHALHTRSIMPAEDPRSPGKHQDAHHRVSGK